MVRETDKEQEYTHLICSNQPLDSDLPKQLIGVGNDACFWYAFLEMGVELCLFCIFARRSRPGFDSLWELRFKVVLGTPIIVIALER